MAYVDSEIEPQKKVVTTVAMPCVTYHGASLTHVATTFKRHRYLFLPNSSEPVVNIDDLRWFHSKKESGGEYSYTIEKKRISEKRLNEIAKYLRASLKVAIEELGFEDKTGEFSGKAQTKKGKGKKGNGKGAKDTNTDSE